MSFEEKLISAVYLRKFIYDKAHPGHAKKGTLDPAWIEIATETGKSVLECKKRWKSLKDTFYKNKKPGASGSGSDGKPRWIWFNHLLFLGEYNEPLSTSDNFDNQEVEFELLDVDEHQGSQYSTPQDTEQESQVSLKQATDSTEPTTPKGQTVPTIVKLPINRRRGNRGGKTLAEQWGDAFERISKTEEPGPKMEDDPISSSFATFIACELKALKGEDQDEFKFKVMDLLMDIKRRKL